MATVRKPFCTVCYRVVLCILIHYFLRRGHLGARRIKDTVTRMIPTSAASPREIFESETGRSGRSIVSGIGRRGLVSRSDDPSVFARPVVALKVLFPVGLFGHGDGS